jgi:hypothetical protein
MLTEPPPTKLPFRNGPSGASVQHFVRSVRLVVGDYYFHYVATRMSVNEEVIMNQYPTSKYPFVTKLNVNVVLTIRSIWTQLEQIRVTQRHQGPIVTAHLYSLKYAENLAPSLVE